MSLKNQFAVKEIYHFSYCTEDSLTWCILQYVVSDRVLLTVTFTFFLFSHGKPWFDDHVEIMVDATGYQ